MTLTPFTHVFAEPDSNHIVDSVNPITGRSAINDETLEQVQARYPLAQLMTWEDWSAQKTARQDAPVAWLPTDGATYTRMLECLPPINWTSFGFLVGEADDHHAGTGEARYRAYRQRSDGTYWCSSRPMRVQEFRDTIHQRKEQ